MLKFHHWQLFIFLQIDIYFFQDKCLAGIGAQSKEIRYILAYCRETVMALYFNRYITFVSFQIQFCRLGKTRKISNNQHYLVAINAKKRQYFGIFRVNELHIPPAESFILF